MEWLLSLALPRVCAGCGGLAERSSSLCPACRDSTRRGEACAIVPEGVTTMTIGPALNGAVRRLVHGLKYDGHRRAVRDLVDLTLSAGGDDLRGKGILVPIPLTAERFRERGYNQAELIARELSRRTGLPVEKRFLVRRVFRGSQTRRSGEERREALGGMFAPGPRFDAGNVPILVDDVLTTGATISACAAICLHGGVREVHGICVAHSPQG